MLTNETVLITGASRGIGQAIALELGKQGAYVVGTATTAIGANNITEWLQQQSINGLGMMLDVKDTSAVNDTVAHITKEHGPVSVLVNNAGITKDNLLLRMKQSEWDSVIDTNLSSVYRLTKSCLRGMMKERKGRIITIASIVGVMGNAGQANYAAAKAGIIGFSKSLAREVGSRGITVNVIAPGFIDTDMTRSLPEETRTEMLANIPLGRLGSTEEIAQTVAFLASPAAAYITGETLHVNGGMYMV